MHDYGALWVELHRFKTLEEAKAKFDMFNNGACYEDEIVL